MRVMKEIKELNEKRSLIYFIHYSCENLNDENNGYSPRITSIAVLHMVSNQMSSFSMHLIAEEMHIQRDKIAENYDKIEKTMLDRFFSFASSKGEQAIWIHWNMNNVNFGFDTLEHRYRVLTDKDAYHINENNRICLSSMIRSKYGSGYAKDPKMINLMKLNGGQHRDFLSGVEEVTSFKANEFIKMHKSTMCKVYFFRNVYDLLATNKLRTENNKLVYKINELYQNAIVQILGILGVIGTIVSLIYTIVQTFKK